MNDHLVLICGESATGKSSSLMNLENALYLNCEAGKKLPFKPKNFKQVIITDPYEVYQAFEQAEALNDYPTLVVDGLNLLMDMYVSVHVNTATDGRKAWGNYAQFFKNLMQQYVSRSTKNVIITAHTKTDINSELMIKETKVPIQGSLSSHGVEAYFSTVVATKKIKIPDLEPYQNDMLTITARDESVGFKHVFQTVLTKDTVNERIRSPIGMFADNETYMNNDAVLLLQRLQDYYAD